MRADLVPGARFPEFGLPDHTGRERTPAELADGGPLVLCFARGWWCPKEQVRLRTLVDMQEAITREYGAIAVVTVDPPAVNGAFRAGLGASFPFLSDADRALAAELELLELTDAKHRPYLPTTFVLDSLLRIHARWTGFWFWGNPTPEELRLALREVTRLEQPTFDPEVAWARRPVPAEAGIDGDTIWVREDAEGRELQRGVHEGPVPEVGEPVGAAGVDGRPWLLHGRAEEAGRTVLRLRKPGPPDTGGAVRHGIVAPPPGAGQ